MQKIIDVLSTRVKHRIGSPKKSVPLAEKQLVWGGLSAGLIQQTLQRV
ncbi:MAG: hypothetical protein AAF664_18425 [Planctomycetota bacterium]